MLFSFLFYPDTEKEDSMKHKKYSSNRAQFIELISDLKSQMNGGIVLLAPSFRIYRRGREQNNKSIA